MDKITVADILKLNPCDTYGEKALVDLIGEGVPVKREAALSLKIPPGDKVWALLRLPLLSKEERLYLGCDFAEHVLPIFETKYPEDARPRQAIEAKRKWLIGEISLEGLKKHQCAAQCAAADSYYASAPASAAPAYAAYASASASVYASAVYASAAYASAYASVYAAYAYAAYAYASASASAYAYASAGEKEDEWQLNKIFDVLEKKGKGRK